jgi:hypothetical protein
MTEYLWVGTDDYFSMDPDAERDTTEGIYNATWTIPKSQYEKLSKADQKKFLPLPFFFQEGAKDSTGREVYLIDQDGDDVDIYAYKGYDDLFYSFSIGPDNQFLNYYAVEPTYTTWTEMRDEVKSKREAGKDPDGTFTITKFITDPDKIKKEWKDSKRKNMREPKAAETDFSAENVEYKFALIGKYPDSDVSEATWEQLPEGMEAIGKTHVTLVSGQSLKEYKKDLKAGAKAAIKEMREPPLPELGQTGVAHRDMADGEVRETYFMEIDNQEDFQDYADELCENLGIANPEPHRYFHISVANNHGGNPFKSVGDITAADLHGFSAENIPLGYVATLAADGETITVGPDKWLADTYGLQTFAVSDDAYTLAYNEGHQDARHKRGYHPRVAKGDERDFFRNTYTAKRQGYKAETFEAKGNRPRDTKGRMVPKQGVTKWGNNYWDYGVTYQEWKYRHPASVRVFAEGWGVDLKSLTPEQKDWLKWRYMEDVDSQTSLAALVDEFKLSAPKRP